MRAYGIIRPRFWTAGSGKSLRGNPGAQVLAMYLMTCGAGTMCGIFHVALPTIAHETGLSPADLPALFEAIRDIAVYDEDEELCWVPNSAREQLGEKLKASDNKWKGLVREIAQFGKHPFVVSFLRLYWDNYNLESSDFQLPSLSSEGASESLESQNEGLAVVLGDSPLEGASKGQGKVRPSPGEVRPDQGGAGGGDPLPPVGKPPDPMARESHWPEHFEPSAENREHAQSAKLDIDEQIAELRTYAKRHARVSYDWHAELEAWMLKSVKFRKQAEERQRAGPQRGRVPQENAGKTGLEGAEVIR